MVWSILFIYVFFILLINFILPEPQRYGIYAKIIYVFTSLILICLLLFRGEVGADWNSGYVLFYEMASDLTGMYNEGLYLGLNVEPGFQFYMSVLKSLNFHQNWIPAALIISILYLLYLNCIKYNLQFLVIISLFTLLNYLHYYEQIRMAVVYSLGILILSTFIYNKNKISYKLILLSTLIQYVSLFYFVLLYGLKFLTKLISSIKIPGFNPKLKLIFNLGLLVMVSSFWGEQLFYLFELSVKLVGTDFFIVDKYFSYSLRSDYLDNQVSYKGSILLFFLAVYFILFFKTKHIFLLSINNKNSILIFMSVCVFLVFNKVPVISHRLLSMILIPSLIILGNIHFNRSRNFSLFFLLFFYSTFKYFNLIKVIGVYNII